MNTKVFVSCRSLENNSRENQSGIGLGLNPMGALWTIVEVVSTQQAMLVMYCGP